MSTNKLEITVTPEDILDVDCWGELREFTDARIALGRTGYSVPTSEYLKFSLAHAMARDTIHTPFDRDTIAEKLTRMGLSTVNVESSAANRSIFLTRPDLGRRLSDKSRERLDAIKDKGADVLLVIGDGLSSKAVHKQAVPLIQHLLPYLNELNLTLGPVILAKQSRVALADDIAEIMHCKLVVILIGERPGLSSPDSLGAYMTYKPYWGRLESERNCISNIRPAGLSYPRAAFKLGWLIEAAFSLHKSGTALKDQSDDPAHYQLLKPLQEREIENVFPGSIS
jgi:ethanolamine ammonia-lyase small subunit